MAERKYIRVATIAMEGAKYRRRIYRVKEKSGAVWFGYADEGKWHFDWTTGLPAGIRYLHNSTDWIRRYLDDAIVVKPGPTGEGVT